jgi:hypothetical protein
MVGKEKRVVAKDTVMAVSEYKGRKLYVLKADGPMAYVGQPGVAIKKIIEEIKKIVEGDNSLYTNVTDFAKQAIREKIERIKQGSSA